MAFTTWKNLETQMLDEMASGQWRLAEHQLADGTRMRFNSFRQFREVLEFVQDKAREEETGVGRRTLAKQGGTGRW